MRPRVNDNPKNASGATWCTPSTARGVAGQALTNAELGEAVAKG